jgi:pimeloyl-ACP methyl ester carboxylesterase
MPRRSPSTVRRVALAALAALAVFAAPPLAAQQDEGFRGQLFLLSFDRWGEALDPSEATLIVQALRENHGVERIVVFSYGWSYDVEGAYRTYRQTLDAMTKSIDASLRAKPGSTIVIGVGWDASLTGFRKLFNDVIPFPMIADALALVPDKVLFPVSFWSKAAMADRIGYGGLRTSLNRIFAEAYPSLDEIPDLYLVGHSFGTRVIAGLLKLRFEFLPVRSEPFEARDRVKGVVLLQPALSAPNLPRHAVRFPIAVTQSEHDHALGWLFPLANLPVNAYYFSAFEALFRREIFGRVNEGVEKTLETATGAAVRQLPGQSQAQPQVPFERARSRVVRSLAEAASIPLTLALSVIAAPIGYLDTQIYSFATEPIDHTMDTLAQIPGIEVGVWALDRALEREVPWGRRGKGIFSLGTLHESVGRTSAKGFLSRAAPEVFGMESVRLVAGEECLLPTCRTTFALDAASVIRTSGLGLDLGQPLADFTIGWIDPIGAHGDYLGAGPVRVIMATLARTEP